MNDVEKEIYSIFTVLSIYVQSFDIHVKKTFPGCNYEFKGIPVYKDRDENIEYLSCILEKISKNNTEIAKKLFFIS